MRRSSPPARPALPMGRWSPPSQRINRAPSRSASRRATVKVAAMHSSPVPLSYTLAVATNDDTSTNGAGFDSHGDALPAEMLPKHLEYNGAQFDLLRPPPAAPMRSPPRGRPSLCRPAISTVSIYWRPRPKGISRPCSMSASRRATSTFRIGAASSASGIRASGRTSRLSTGPSPRITLCGLPRISRIARSGNIRPAIPRITSVSNPATSSPRRLPGSPRTITPPPASMNLINIPTFLRTHWIFPLAPTH